MALTITLAPEVEAKLRRQAQAEHRTPEDLAAEWVRLRASENTGEGTPGQAFLHRLETMRQSLPETGSLPEAAFERETAYHE